MFNPKKNVKNIELKNSLETTLEKNLNAIDFITNELNTANDNLKYNPDDELLKYRCKQLEYIGFCLSYLDKMYVKSYKQVGGKVVRNIDE